MLNLAAPSRFIWALSICLFICLFTVVGEAAYAKATIDPEADYPRILGLRANPTVPYTPQQVLRAYRDQLMRHHPSSPQRRRSRRSTRFDLQALQTAKEVMSDPVLREQWARSRRRSNSPVGAELANSLPSESQVGTDGEYFRAFWRGRPQIWSFAGAPSVEENRLTPEHNLALRRLEEHLDGKTSGPIETYVHDPLAFLEEKWKWWDGVTVGDQSSILKEFIFLIDQLEVVSSAQVYSHPAFRKARAFFTWWFGRPESVVYPELFFKNIRELNRDGGASLVLITGALENSLWRTREVAEVIFENTIATYTQLTIAMASPELITESDLRDRLMADPRYEKYGNHFAVASIDSELALQNPEWIERFFGDPETVANVLLRIVWRKAWREQHPDLISRGLKILADVEHSSLASISQDLLAAPDSIQHPEWLEILVKTNTGSLTQRLNQVLALDHWYNDIYVRHILKGRELSLDNLVIAEWRNLRELPPVIQKFNYLRGLPQPQELPPPPATSLSLGACLSVFAL